MKVNALLQLLRENGWELTKEVRDPLSYLPITTEDKEVICQNSILRLKLLEEIGPADGNSKFSEINRFILQQEILHTRGGCWGFPDAMLWAVENLCSIGNPEDLILLYEAKYINWDTEMGVLSSYFLRADKKESIKYLKILGTEQASEVADFVEGL